MPSDRRESAVYVSIEDQTYIGPPIEGGRSVFGVILTDRGEDMKVITSKSRQEYHKKFGEPDVAKCSETHYTLSKCFEYTSEILSIRVTPDDATYSNAYIRMNDAEEARLMGDGDVEAYVLSGYVQSGYSYEGLGIPRDFSFINRPHPNNEPIYPRREDYLDEDEFEFALNGGYYDITDPNKTLYEDDGGGTRTGWEPGYNDIKDEYGNIVPGKEGSKTIYEQQLNLSRMVYCEENLVGISDGLVGKWIFPASDQVQPAVGSSNSLARWKTTSRQIISITPAATSDIYPNGSIIHLDRPYHNTEFPFTSNTQVSVNQYNAVIYEPMILDYAWAFRDVGSPILDPETGDRVDFIYQFYAIGRGKYYDNILIKGERNFEMEKLYTDDDGDPLYKYIFLDIEIYSVNSLSDQVREEGPWTVALPRRTPNGDIIRDYFGGTHINIVDVINRRSEIVRVREGNQASLLSNLPLEASENRRLQLMLMFLGRYPFGMVNMGPVKHIDFKYGSDGTGLYDTSGRINVSNALFGRVARAYNGDLPSYDGSIEALRDTVYQRFGFDYVISGGYPVNVQYAARGLAAHVETCHHLGDPGVITFRYDDDLNYRTSSVAWNNWTSSLYVQYREIYDNYSGRYIWVSPVYHAIQRHLDVDNKYFLSEPVANIEKGAIGEEIRLAYSTNHSIRGDLWDAELNYTIEEPDGVYLNSQFTTWKRFSALKRQHVAKFTSYLKKTVPRLLKDILQRKATTYWLNNAQFRLDNFLSSFLETGNIDRYVSIVNYNVNLVFDDTRSELNVYIDFKPTLAIERINVFITLKN